MSDRLMAAAVAVAITLFALVCLDSTNQGGNNYQPPTPTERLAP